MDPTAVLLLQMGGPDSLDEVEDYIRILFSDRDLVQLPAPLSWFQNRLARRVARRRAPIVREQYALIGGGSPIGRITRAQAAALEKELRSDGAFRCFAAMAYTRPSIGGAVEQALAAGCRRFVALSLFPQYCQASTGAAFRDLRENFRRLGVGPEQVAWIDRWGSDAGFLDALAARTAAALEEAARAHPAAPQLLVSAHGAPEALIRRGDPYEKEVRATMEGLRSRLDPATPVTLSFQSRATPVRWIKPPTDATLRRLGAEGVKNVVVLPVSFVSDHVETLFEIDLLLGDVARSAGIEHYMRVPSFNDGPELVSVLARLVRARS